MAKLSVIFGYGLFSARPAAGTEGAHYFATDTGLEYRDNGTTWDALPAFGLVFKFSTTTTDSDPGAGILRFNHATPASVTTIYVDDQSGGSNADLSTVWANLTGARILITQHDDGAKYLLGEVTAVLDGTGYYKLTVTVDDSGTLIDDLAAVSFVVLGGGGGGGATTQWWDRPGAPTGLLVSFENRIAYANSTLSVSVLGVAQQEGQSVVPSYGGDTEVGCNNAYDTTPSTANTGFQWIKSYGKFGNGAYGLLQARWPVGVLNNLFWGFFSTFAPVAAPTTSNAGCMFMKRSADTNWQFAYGPGDGATAWTFVDTGVAWNAANWHNFEIDCYNDGGTIKAIAYIDGVEVANITSGLPALTKALDRMYTSWIIDGAFDTVNDDTGIFIRSLKWISGRGDELTSFA